MGFLTLLEFEDGFGRGFSVVGWREKGNRINFGVERTNLERSCNDEATFKPECCRSIEKHADFFASDLMHNRIIV